VRNATKAAGDDHARPVGGDVVQPVRISHVHPDPVRAGALGQQLLPDGQDLGEVDVVPDVVGGLTRNILPSNPAQPRPGAG
jgi:hypothetical protein